MTISDEINSFTCDLGYDVCDFMALNGKPDTEKKHIYTKLLEGSPNAEKESQIIFKFLLEFFILMRVSKDNSFKLEKYEGFMYSCKLSLPHFFIEYETLDEIREINELVAENFAENMPPLGKSIVKKIRNIESYLTTINMDSKTTTYYCENMLDVAVASIYHTFKLGLTFKICENCGLWFVPLYRSDRKYCNRPAPQAEGKTCQDYGLEKAWSEKLNKDEAAGLYREVYIKLQLQVKRNPANEAYAEKFEEFKSLSKAWKKGIAEGLKSKDDYIEWLKNF
ncbi:MAG: DUF6076 domain-containing protein [Bacillota bacterium]